MAEMRSMLSDDGTRMLFGMPEDEYRSHPYLAQSDLKKLMWTGELVPLDQNAPGLRMGRLVHGCLEHYLTEGDPAAHRLDGLSSSLCKRASHALESGLDFIDERVADDARAEMSLFVHADRFDVSDPELERTYTYPDYARWLPDLLAKRGLEGIKGRVDCWAPSDQAMYDWKLTSERTERGVVSTMKGYGYWIQAVHYLTLMEACGRRPSRVGYVYVSANSVECVPPIHLNVVMPKDAHVASAIVRDMKILYNKGCRLKTKKIIDLDYEIMPNA